ncbi:MAG: prepilin-type N-terminal cleavage/methylation domain-containing protein [Phycisphaeraceae bacterium]
MTARNRNKGFTLVEILIVVVILGILAAIVIPQFTNASESARGSSLVTQLQTLRSQLELYQVQHNGDYPTVAQLGVGAWGVMINKTDADGTINAAGDFGPYLQQAPANALHEVAGSRTGVAADNSLCWQYDEDTGQIVAVVAAAKAADLGLAATDFVAAP